MQKRKNLDKDAHFDPRLQPCIVTNITPGVTVVIEPPPDDTKAFLRLNGLFVLNKKVVLKYGEWHLFLNSYFNEPYSDPSKKPFSLHRNFDVDEFLKSKGMSSLQDLQMMILKSAELKN